MINSHYMKVGDTFHCLGCHQDYPSKDDGVIKHHEICKRSATYCDKNCKTDLLKNCFKCFKPLILVPDQTHTWYCPCSPDKFLSIG